jgi:hypothetical protein
MTDKTLFQQLIVEEYAEQIIEDLEGIEWDETDKLEIAISITEEDVPRILDELRELADDQ